MDEDIMCLLTHLMGKLTQIGAKNSQKFANTFKASPQCLGGEVHRHQLNGILRRWRESGWVSLKTQFCHFLFSKASVFVPFYWNDNETSISLVFECAGSQYTVDQEKDEETDGRKRCLSPYIYILLRHYKDGSKSLHPYFQSKNIFRCPFVFSSFSQFLHLCPASVSLGQDHLY